MAIYSVDIKFCATVYVRAADETAAIAMVEGRYGDGLVISLPIGTGDPVDGEPAILSDLPLEDPNLPDISLSPAVTSYGLWDHGYVDCIIE